LQLFEAIKAGDKPLIKDALDRVEWELDDVAALAKRIAAVRPEAHEPLEAFNLRRRGLKVGRSCGPVFSALDLTLFSSSIQAEVKDAERDKSVKKLEGFWAELMDAEAKLMVRGACLNLPSLVVHYHA
jgi:hypothetical protein